MPVIDPILAVWRDVVCARRVCPLLTTRSALGLPGSGKNGGTGDTWALWRDLVEERGGQRYDPG
jgi:hypothetical protein